MKLVISGQKAFGREVLKRLIDDGHEILGVAVAPQGRQKDKMVGLATRYGIPVLAEADKLVSDMIPDGTDLVVTAHSHWIISDQIMSKAKYGAIGFHPSLLPLHRGVDSVRWTLKMGDRVTGGTVFQLDDKADHGPVICQRLVYPKLDWDYHDLWNAIFPVGVEMMSEVIKEIETDGGIKNAVVQDDDIATWEPSFKRPRLARNELIRLG